VVRTRSEVPLVLVRSPQSALRPTDFTLFDHGANHPPPRLVDCSPMDVQALHHRSKESRERDACHPVLNSVRSMYQAGQRDPFRGNEAFFFFLIGQICCFDLCSVPTLSWT